MKRKMICVPFWNAERVSVPQFLIYGTQGSLCAIYETQKAVWGCNATISSQNKERVGSDVKNGHENSHDAATNLA
jgi:hypothetical protein